MYVCVKSAACACILTAFLLHGKEGSFAFDPSQEGSVHEFLHPRILFLTDFWGGLIDSRRHANLALLLLLLFLRY